MPDSWSETSLRRVVEEIPDVATLNDIDGNESLAFGAKNSGHAFLFDSRARCVFSGGVTSGRGHEGDSTGKSTIFGYVAGLESPVVTPPALETTAFETPVFGCSLRDEAVL